MILNVVFEANVGPEKGEKYRVNILNATKPAGGNMFTHKRCGNVFGTGGSDDEGIDPMGWLF